MVLAQYLDYEVVDLVFLCILVQETSRKLRRGPVLSRFWCFSPFPSAGGVPQAPFFRPKMTETIFLRLEACRRRLFFGQKWHFGRKSHFWAQKSHFFAQKRHFFTKNIIFASKNSVFLPFLAFLKQKQPFFTPRCSSPYRIVTNPYTLNIELCQLFFNTFVLYGRAIDFHFRAVPSL